MRRLSKIFGKVLSVLVLAGFACSVPVRAAGDQPSVPYVPTPQAVVDRMRRAGADAFVTKGCRVEDLLRAIRG